MVLVSKTYCRLFLSLFVLDHAEPYPVLIMEPVVEDKSSQVIMESYQNLRVGYSKIIHLRNPKIIDIEKIDKFYFHKRAEKAFTMVMSGDLRIYANLLLVKGVSTRES